jgi:GT2 family glycosyltransferase
MKLSFVILTWNSGHTIADCLNSISQACDRERIAYEVFIVDNGSGDATCPIIRTFDKLPLHLTCYPENHGTTKTRNEVLRQCTGDVVCVMDSDAAFVQGSLRELISTLMDDPSIGIIAPKLVEKSGRVQPSVKRWPTLLGKFSRIPKILFKLNIPDPGVYPEFPFTEVREVDCAISASWFFRRGLLFETGYLDERIFYAPEDVDFCLRVWKCGRRVVYYPYFTVLHQPQQITHKKVFSKVALSHFFGLMYYFLKHRYVRKPNIGRMRKRERSDRAEAGIKQF